MYEMPRRNFRIPYKTLYTGKTLHRGGETGAEVTAAPGLEGVQTCHQYYKWLMVGGGPVTDFAFRPRSFH